jgi:membrane-bound inhibitor of C-type lysozyme
MNAKGWGILVIIVILVGAIVLYWTHGDKMAAPDAAQEQVAHAVFACDNDGSIDATFSEGESAPAAEPGMPPTPNGSVKLVLSDSRELTLAQTISADGARYANADESVVFWNVGNGATYTEGTEDGGSETVTCTAQ